MIAISEHAFFDRVDVFNLYKDASCRLDAGRIAPRPDAAWTRRQFSSIWAPQPQAYTITTTYDVVKSDKSISLPIQEGEENEGFFLARQSGSKPLLVGIREGNE